MNVGVGGILDYQDLVLPALFNELPPPLLRQGGTGGVLEIADRVEQLHPLPRIFNQLEEGQQVVHP